MRDTRTIITDIISGFYELAEVLEEQENITKGRLDCIDDRSIKCSNALKGIVDVINNELS